MYHSIHRSNPLWTAFSLLPFPKIRHPPPSSRSRSFVHTFSRCPDFVNAPPHLLHQWPARRPIAFIRSNFHPPPHPTSSVYCTFHPRPPSFENVFQSDATLSFLKKRTLSSAGRSNAPPSPCLFCFPPSPLTKQSCSCNPFFPPPLPKPSLFRPPPRLSLSFKNEVVVFER